LSYRIYTVREQVECSPKEYKGEEKREKVESRARRGDNVISWWNPCMDKHLPTPKNVGEEVIAGGTYRGELKPQIGKLRSTVWERCRISRRRVVGAGVL